MRKEDVKRKMKEVMEKSFGSLETDMQKELSHVLKREVIVDKSNDTVRAYTKVGDTFIIGSVARTPDEW